MKSPQGGVSFPSGFRASLTLTQRRERDIHAGGQPQHQRQLRRNVGEQNSARSSDAHSSIDESGIEAIRRDSSRTSESNTLIARDKRLSSLNEYQKFLVFVRIMLKFIENQNDAESETLLRRAKHVIEVSQMRSKLGDANFLPVQESVIVRLRATITNSLYWNITRDYLGYSCD